MFKGLSTYNEYEECLRRGLCEEHLKEINQNGQAAVKNDFPEKAFKFVRVNILCPLLNKTSPKCDKIKKLMEKTPPIAKILAGNNLTEDAVDVIFVMDSVVIFTLCQLSKICCIGALFHTTKKANCDDPDIKAIQKLIVVERFENADIRYLYPILQKNFTSCDLDIIRATHCITLLFIRKFCYKQNMKIAIETVEKDIHKTNCENTLGSSVIEKMHPSNFYSSPEYLTMGKKFFFDEKKFKLAALYCYISISLDPLCTEAYYLFVQSLLRLKLCDDIPEILQFGYKYGKQNPKVYRNVIQSIEDIKAGRPELQLIEVAGLLTEKSVNHNIVFDKVASPKKEKSKSQVVDLVDSDSAESDCESIKEKKLSINESKEKSKSKSSGISKKKRTISEGSVDIQPEEELDVSKINLYLKEASEALLADCGYKSVQLFRGPLRNFIENSKFQSFEECDIVCIKYSYGVAYCKSGGYDDLQKCITILKDILENHDSITFPAVHYSLGLAYRKLNRFKEALHYLENVQSFLCKGIHFKVYPWPGMTTVIQETKPDVLKTLVQDLIKECENPPNPDAYCRHATCSFQPTIYYTDPDFKGYISLSCSEQCNMQYHLLCWKAMKEEKDLTDKEFLDKPCFTPDCDGIIVKFHNIDRKGDLTKEFTSEFKKPPKQKCPKWEKKIDIKEKKKKKINAKSAEGSQEVLNENESMSSRKSSVSQESTLQFADPDVPAEETASKPECAERSLQKINENADVHTSSSNNSNCSSVQETLNINDGGVNGHETTHEEKSEASYQLMECIKNNVYSFLADFLEHNGPLKVDDSLLTNEVASFPDDVHKLISEYGGIGEFLKDDLRFAFVGDLYVCVIDDLASAYQMLSTSSLSSDLQSLESHEESNYYNKSKRIFSTGHSVLGLNPEAQEYTPVVSSNNKSSSYKFTENDSHFQSFNSNCSLPTALESPSKNSNILNKNSQLDTFDGTDMFVSKSKSCDTVLNNKFQSNTNCLFSTASHYEQSDKGIKKVTKQYPNESKLPTEQLNSISGINRNFLETFSLRSHGASNENDNMFPMIVPDRPTSKENCNEQIKNSDTSTNSSLKQYSIKVMSESVSFGTMTDFKLISKEEYDRKEQEWLTEKKSLLDDLKNSNELAHKLQGINVALTDEKNNLQKNVESLTSSLRKVKEENKNVLLAQEKKFNVVIQTLQHENNGFKNRIRDVELQVLNMKKTEYLKRIESKSLEAVTIRKGMSGVLSHLNPALHSCVKSYSVELITYANELNTTKLEFMKGIDELIRKVENGASLKDLKDIEMKELPPVPNLKSTLANGPPTGMFPFNAMAPYLGLLNAGTSPLLSSSTVVPPTAASKTVPPTAVIPKVIPPSAPITPSSVPITPGIPPVTSASTLPMSVPSVLDAKKKGKADLSADLDLKNLNPTIQESFKSAMASINSYASTPYSAPSLDDEFDKNCVVFKHSDPVSKNKLDLPKGPPGLLNSVSSLTSNLAASLNSVSEPKAGASTSGKKSYESLDTVPKFKMNPCQSTLEKKTSTAGKSYEKLLKKLEEQFPSYSKEELVLFMTEYRTQRQGSLSGLPMDTIISQISTIIKSKKKMVSETKVYLKPTKVLVNKKLVPDPKPPPVNEAQGAKKKTAWNIDADQPQYKFTGSSDDDCTICYDPMTKTSAYKVACGHTFHEKCIRQWLKKNSNCPMCRVLLLLPEEYPSLS